MGRPSKTTLTVIGHRTKAELEHRKAAEEALLTGTPMKVWPEVRADKVAYKEFKRVRNLLQKIEKDDALHEGVINRYALLRSECVAFEKKREEFYSSLAQLQQEWESGDSDMKLFDYFKLLASMQGQVVAIDKQIQAKRKMLLDIEKENIMTIASALRSIPKTPEKKQKSPMAEFMEKRNAKKS